VRTVTVTPGWAFSLWSVERLLRASRACDVRRRAPLARCAWRSRAVVTLCTVRTMGRPLLLILLLELTGEKTHGLPIVNKVNN